MQTYPHSNDRKLSPLHRMALGAILAAATSVAIPAFSQAQDQKPDGAPDWYNQQEVDAWARDYVALLNSDDVAAVNQAIPLDGIYENAIVSLVGDTRKDPEVLAYLKQFFPTFKTIMLPDGNDKSTKDFLRSGVESGIVYFLVRSIPKNAPKAPDINYLQVVIEAADDGDGYLVNDVFVVRADVSASRVAQHLFVLLMPDAVFEKVGGWNQEQQDLHAQREDILAIFKQAQAKDPSCIDSFLALDPPRPENVVLLETVSKTVFENSDDPEQIKAVMKAWQLARPKGICMLLWNAYGMRRLGGEGYEQANKILGILRDMEMYSSDAYLDVLSADNSMRLDQAAAAETHARSAIAKESNLYIARHVLHLILAKNQDYGALATALEELAAIDSAFAITYIGEQEALADFRDSEQGKALTKRLQADQ